jgi:hypothetical protein
VFDEIDHRRYEAQSMPPSLNQIALAPRPQRGHLYGTGLLGSVEHYIETYGPAAAHAVIARLPQHREYLRPNVPAMGMLAARPYPYAFVGDLVRAMALAAKRNEDAYIREFSVAGIDRTLKTVARFVLRHLVSPADVARRGQQLWDLYHDSGRVVITDLTPHAYVSTISDWKGHDIVVCRIAAESRRRVVELSGGHNVEVRRERCVGWGHESCRFRIRWDNRA